MASNDNNCYKLSKLTFTDITDVFHFDLCHSLKVTDIYSCDRSCDEHIYIRVIKLKIFLGPYD